MKSLLDGSFIKTLAALALPIALQQLITSSLNMVALIMVGQLGETAIAGVGIANQMFFLLHLILFGTNSGASIFACQYWGKGDLNGVRNVLGLSLKVTCLGALIFTLICFIFPSQVIGIFTADPKVIEAGTPFLKLNSLSFIVYGISFTYTSMSRSIGYVKMPMFISIGALSLNTLLNYLLITGNMGFPAMGVSGAGLAIVISRVLEALVLILVIYLAKYPIAAGWRDLLSFDLSFFKSFVKTSLPVIVHEGIWSLGMTLYVFIYSRMGTNIIAAVNISSNIERLSMVLFFGIANACAIMIGHRIGESKPDDAYKDAGRLLALGPVIGVVFGLLLFALYGSVLPLFNVVDDVKHSASQILTVLSIIMPLKVFNLIMIIGVSRAGGDTRYGIFMENGPLWLAAIPLAALGGLYFGLPLIAVYLLACTEELLKLILGFRRYISKKWIHNVIQC